MISASPRARLLLAVASGGIFAASTPPLDFLAGIPLGLGLFAVVLDDPRAGPRAGAARGWLFGLAANLVALRFVPEVVTRFTPLPLVAGWAALALLAAAQALPWALGGALARSLGLRARTPGFLAFALGVYAATFVPAIFPWTPAGGLSPWPLLVQTAELVGERGTSMLLAASAALVASGLLDAARARAGGERGGRLARAAAPSAVGLALALALAGHGALRMRAVERARGEAPHARVALVQPDFDAFDRWDEARAAMMLERLTALTKSAEARGAVLTIWPESAYPYTLAHATRRSPSGARAILQRGVRGPVLTGAYMAGAQGVAYNSAILATPDGAISKPYDKRHLLWFGETVPLSETFPWLRRVFARGTGLAAGHESVLFEAGPVRATVLNCYEDTLPAAGREAMSVRPNLLVNVTNDAWFAGSAEGELHLRLSALRAIETRRDLVRAVNRGPTSWIDAAGVLRARYDGPLAAAVPVEPALLEAPLTLYVRFGDLPLLALAAAAVGAQLLRARRAATTPSA